jgi:archaellum component FlaC
VDGNWETYKTFRASSDMLKEGSEILENLNRAYEEAKQEYEYVNADGTTQKWKMEKPVEEIKSEILKEIEIVSEQLETMQKVYNESFDMLKGFDYELLKV